MTIDKPPFDPYSKEKYLKWLQDELNVEVPIFYENYYSSVVDRMKSTFEKSDFWANFLHDLKNFDFEYFQHNDFRLINTFNPVIESTPYNSFLLKTYRRNVLENKKWPEEPFDGWYLPENWLIKVNDIIRTLVVVKYLSSQSH